MSDQAAAPSAPQRVRMRLGVRLLVCALIYGPAVYFKWQGDLVTAGILAAIGIAAFAGFRAGALSILCLLAAAAAAIWVAPTMGLCYESTVSACLGTTGLTNRLISVLVAAVAILVAGSLVSMVVARRLAKRPRLDAINRWLGFAIGGAEGAVAVVLLLGGILVVEPRERERAPRRDPEDTRGLMISKLILSTSEQTRQSLVGPTLVAHNPFETIPPLQKFEEVQQTVEVLKDPGKIQQMLHDPSIRQLQQSPEVQQAVEELRRDPEVAEILRARQVDAAMALKLMNHPALLRLLDQPGFLDRAGEVIRNMQRSATADSSPTVEP